ncbi:hypothetical protein ES703_103858 [subsurface metagenome]
MGQGYLRFDSIHHDLDYLFIVCTRITDADEWRSVGSFSHKCQGNLVWLNYAVFCSGLDSHIGHGEPLSHGKLFDNAPREFQGAVVCAVNSQRAQGIEYKVFSPHPGQQRALVFDFDCWGYLEPGLAGGQYYPEVGTPDTGGKGAQGAVRTGMAICPDNQISRYDEALFRQKYMFDTGLPHFIVMVNLMVNGKFPHHLGLLG